METKILYNENDYEAIKILDGFLPDKIFDTHMHLLDSEFEPEAVTDGKRVVYEIEDYKKEMSPVLCNPKVLRTNIITHPNSSLADLSAGNYKKADEFLIKQLNKEPQCVGEIIVFPGQTPEEIEKRLVHPRFRGFKCYYNMGSGDRTFDSSIGEYLPEYVWELANKNKMCITLHMVKEKALADKDNLEYIKTMAKKYPDAVLILAHAARGFAAWTAIETISEVARFDNIWFDFSAICESPAMFQIMKKAGLERCMWGSDYPGCGIRGKAVSIADSFYWIMQQDIDNFDSKTPVRTWTYATENLMATRQACILADLRESQIEDLFYNNAARLFDGK